MRNNVGLMLEEGDKLDFNYTPGKWGSHLGITSNTGRATIYMDMVEARRLRDFLIDHIAHHTQPDDVPWKVTCTFEGCQHGHCPDDHLSYQVPHHHKVIV